MTTGDHKKVPAGVEGKLGYIAGKLEIMHEDVKVLKETSVDKGTCKATHEATNLEIRKAFAVARRAEDKTNPGVALDRPDGMTLATKVLTLVALVGAIIGGLLGAGWWVVSQMQAGRAEERVYERKLEKKVRDLERAVRKPGARLRRIEKNQGLLFTELGKLGWFDVGEVSVPFSLTAATAARRFD